MNWNFDMPSKTATHASGLRVRFLARNGDWKGTPIAPIPNTVNPMHLPHLLREATLHFLDEWLRLRRVTLFFDRERA